MCLKILSMLDSTELIKKCHQDLLHVKQFNFRITYKYRNAAVFFFFKQKFESKYK